MDRNIYLRKFSRIVRWSLSKSEADEAIADYKEMLGEYAQENNSDLIKTFETSMQAAKMLIEPHTYRNWLAAFGIMLVCLLLPAWWLIQTSFPKSIFAPLSILFLFGNMAAFVRFSPQKGEEKTPIPKKLILALTAILVMFALACGVLAGLAAGIWTLLPSGMYGFTAHLVLCLTGVAATVCAVVGLIKARLSERRWGALYLLGLTVLVGCVLIVSILCSMSLDIVSSNGWLTCAAEFGVIGVVGLAMTGRTLC